MEIEALNRAGATAGQKVRVIVHSYTYMKGTFLIYGLPALFLVLGAVFGKEFMPARFPTADPDTLSAIFGFSFMLISFILVKILANRIGNKTESKPVIEDILS